MCADVITLVCGIVEAKCMLFTTVRVCVCVSVRRHIPTTARTRM